MAELSIKITAVTQWSCSVVIELWFLTWVLDKRLWEQSDVKKSIHQTGANNENHKTFEKHVIRIFINML